LGVEAAVEIGQTFVAAHAGVDGITLDPGLSPECLKKGGDRTENVVWPVVVQGVYEGAG
jgi:hypothetical protein